MAPRETRIRRRAWRCPEAVATSHSPRPPTTSAPRTTTPCANVYVRDTQTGETTLVSRADGVDGAGATGGDSGNPAMSPAGRYVAFESDADNLSDADDDSVTNVYVRDMFAGTTTLVSRADTGPADGPSHNPSVSAQRRIHRVRLGGHQSLGQRRRRGHGRVRPRHERGHQLACQPPADRCGQRLELRPLDLEQRAEGRVHLGCRQPDDVDIDSFSNVYVADRRFGFLSHVSRTTVSGVDQPARRPRLVAAVDLRRRPSRRLRIDRDQPGSRSLRIGAAGLCARHPGQLDDAREPRTRRDRRGQRTRPPRRRPSPRTAQWCRSSPRRRT